MKREDVGQVFDAWVLQLCSAKDFYECTLTVEEWMARPTPYDVQIHRDGRLLRWQMLMEACARVADSVCGDGGLRDEPRVGYDPVRDQTFFLFKADNNGNTYLVSPGGIAGVGDLTAPEVPKARGSVLPLE